MFVNQKNQYIHNKPSNFPYITLAYTSHIPDAYKTMCVSQNLHWFEKTWPSRILMVCNVCNTDYVLYKPPII